MSEWQPIDTAPKEDVILLYLGDGQILTGYYDPLIDEDFCDNARGTYHFNATHWMPLPKPPEN